MENSVIKKRIIVGVSYLFLFVVVGFLLYLVFSPASTCFDNIKNQGEKNVDCGGPCSPCQAVSNTQDIAITEKAFVTGGNDTYDVVAKISNPNDAVGASSFKYTFILKDASGAVLATRDGTSFLLPADSKFIAELGLQAPNGVAPASVEISITDPQWVKLDDVSKPQLGIYSKKFDKAPMGDGSQASGVLRNESSYDLKEISLVIVLRDEKGQVVGLNTTKQSSVRAREERDFSINWPYALPGSVQSIDIDAQSNVFDPQNFSFSVQ